MVEPLPAHSLREVRSLYWIASVVEFPQRRVHVFDVLVRSLDEGLSRQTEIHEDLLRDSLVPFECLLVNAVPQIFQLL